MEGFDIQISIPADGDYDFDKTDSDYDFESALKIGRELEEFLGRQPEDTRAYLGMHNITFGCPSQAETDALVLRVYDWADERGLDLVVNVVYWTFD